LGVPAVGHGDTVMRAIPAAILLVAFTACLTPGTAGPTGMPGAAATTQRQPPSVEAVKARTVNLDVGMTDAQVLKVLGPPDETEGKVCGERTSQIWTCVTWTYKTSNEGMPLVVLFEKGPPMTVHSWFWPQASRSP